MFVKSNSEKNLPIQDWSAQTYLDFLGGKGIYALGYRQTRLIQALKLKLERLTIVPGSLISQLAKGQSAWELPGDLQVGAFFTKAEEAILEASIMAGILTSRPKIIYTQPNLEMQLGSLTAPGQVKRKAKDNAAGFCWELVPYGLLEPLKASINEDTAAVIIEPIQVEAGVLVPNYGYLRLIRKFCDEQGAQLILDESQLGFGRTGYSLASEREDILPDLLITRFPAESTHLKEVRDKGDYLFRQLQSFPKIYPTVVTAVRGRGLLVGIELSTKELVGVVLSQLSEYRISACRAQNNPWVIRFRPPLIISYPQMDYFIAALENSIKYAEKLS